MRNLKKVLALGLALIMAMSLMLSASAFTDDASITNVAAANLLTDLNILGGFPDGSFKPADLVTRAQMAKMVYVALRGGVNDEAILFANASVPLSDINSHWAKGYIKFAYANQIIGGFPDGTFKPEDSVTGFQAAKMLLTALGYSASVEGYTGAGWDYNVAIDALNAGLLDGGLSATDLSLPLTRDSAALMFYNALYAKTVAYPSGVLTLGQNSMLTVKYSLTAVTGILTKTDELGFGGKAAAGKCVIGGTTYSVDAPASLLGQQVTINIGAASKVYGAVKATSNNVVRTSYKGGVADTASGYNTTGAEYSNNYAALGEVGSLADATKIGDKTVYIDNDGDKSYDVIIVTNYVYSTAAITVLSAGNTIAVANLYSGAKAVTAVTGSDTVADGDKVLGYAYPDNGIFVIAKAVPTTMLYSGIVGTQPKLDGTLYAAASITGYTGFGALTDGTIVSGTAVNVVMLNGYVVAYIAPSTGGSSAPTLYCGIRATATGTAAQPPFVAAIPAKVAVTLADGTEAIYDVASIASAMGISVNNQTQLDTLIGKLVTYSMDNGKIKILTLASGTLNAVGGSGNAAGAGLVTINSGVYVVNASTVVFNWNSGTSKFAVYTGKANIPAFEAADTASVIASGVPLTAKVILSTGVTPATVTPTSVNKTGIVISYEIKSSAADEVYYAIKMFDGTGIVTVNTATSTTLTNLNTALAASSLVANAIMEYTLVDGLLDTSSEAFMTVGVVNNTQNTSTSYVGGFVNYYQDGLINICLGGTAATDELYVVKSDALTVQLAGMTTANPMAAVGAINPVMTNNDINAKGATKYNVILKIDSAGKVVAIYYYTDGDLTFPAT